MLNGFSSWSFAFFSCNWTRFHCCNFAYAMTRNSSLFCREKKRLYAFTCEKKKTHHHQKLIDFEMFTRIQSWLECSQCSNEIQPIARLMLNIALSLHLIDEMFSVFMFRQISIITLCVRTFWLYTRYAGYQSRFFL